MMPAQTAVRILRERPWLGAANSTAPGWARELLERVLTDCGWPEDDVAGVRLIWRRSRSPRVDASTRSRLQIEGAGASVGSPAHTSQRRRWSSGRTWPAERRIAITAGADRTDQRLVLLHEAAHLLTPGHHHDHVFWAIAWSLYRAYRIPIRTALAREDGATSLEIAACLGVRGAKAAQARQAGGGVQAGHGSGGRRER